MPPRNQGISTGTPKWKSRADRRHRRAHHTPSPSPGRNPITPSPSADRGSDGQVQRIHVIHRTSPETVETDDTARDLTPAHPAAVVDLDDGDAPPQPTPHPASAPCVVTTTEALPAAASIYRQTCQEHAAAWRHDTLIAITIGGKTGRAAIRHAGHGTTAAARVLDAHRTGLADTLAQADATVETWLAPADLTDWIRDGYDPASAPVTRRLRSTVPADPLPFDPPSTGAPPAGPGRPHSPAGPVAVAETWSTVHTDSAFHQVLWVSDWPRFDTHPAFLAPLFLPAGATVITTLIYEPIPTPDALRQIGRDKVAQASDAALRRRLGTLDTAEQAARATDTAQREADLAAGHLDMRHTALISITAATRDELTDATTSIRQAAAAAGCDTRILYGQQLAALGATILPTGLRL